MAGTGSTTFEPATGLHQSIWTTPIINASPLAEWEPIHNLSKESNTDESVLKEISQHKLDSRLDWGVASMVGFLRTCRFRFSDAVADVLYSPLYSWIHRLESALD